MTSQWHSAFLDKNVHSWMYKDTHDVQIWFQNCRLKNDMVISIWHTSHSVKTEVTVCRTVCHCVLWQSYLFLSLRKSSCDCDTVSVLAVFTTVISANIQGPSDHCWPHAPQWASSTSRRHQSHQLYMSGEWRFWGGKVWPLTCPPAWWPVAKSKTECFVPTTLSL